jgi:uncharacterized membrane protein
MFGDAPDSGAAMAKKNVPLVGESWATSATHTKGFDQFGSVTFHLRAEPLVTALKDSDFDLTYMPAHEAATAFPFDLDGLKRYDAIILSDIGTNPFFSLRTSGCTASRRRTA